MDVPATPVADPGTEVECFLEDSDDGGADGLYQTSPNHSIMYALLRFPLLFLGFILISVDLCLYFLVRQWIAGQEFLLLLGSTQRRLLQKLQQSREYSEWHLTAQFLDKELGNDDFKSAYPSNLVDAPLLAKLTGKLRKISMTDDPENVKQMIAILKTSVCKSDVGGIEEEKLYSNCFLGTNHCVQNYVDQVMISLKYVSNSRHLSDSTKQKFFSDAYDTFGRTALCLSGGGSLSYMHFGVCKALIDANMLPKIITGSSAGCVAAAFVCTRTDKELKSAINTDIVIHVTAAQDTFLQRLKRFWRTGAIFDKRLWIDKIQWFTKGLTFLEAHERTGRILNISVVSHEKTGKSKVLNYLTAPNILIASAIVASSAIPGILEPVQLLQKSENGYISPYNGSGRVWRDGSFSSDIPKQELQQLFHVKSIIASQVNPHIQPFFFNSRGSAGAPTLHRRGFGWYPYFNFRRGGFILASIVQFLRLDLLKWLGFIRDMRLLPRIGGVDFSQVFLQQFEGNITVLPEVGSIADLFLVIEDPSRERFARYVRAGERATWPKLCMIRNRWKIEKFLMERRTKPQGVVRRHSFVS